MNKEIKILVKNAENFKKKCIFQFFNNRKMKILVIKSKFQRNEMN